MDKTETEKAKVTVGNLIPFDNWLKSIGRGRVNRLELAKKRGGEGNRYFRASLHCSL
jgi:hypothetical protein